MGWRKVGIAVVLASVVASSAFAEGVIPSTATDGALTVTLLGTGTPDPRIDRFGPATLVTAGGQALLFDVGRGAIQRLQQIGVSPGKLDQIFFTHYHSDHVNGLPDLWLTARLPPHGGRRGALPVSGPNGLQALTEGLRAAFANDIGIREADEKLPPESTLFAVTQFDENTEPVVYEKDGLKVTAFKVNHGELIHPSVGYRIDYGENTVVLSGDTKYEPNLIKHAEGADLVIHEVAMAADDMLDNPAIKRILAHHTTPREAGGVFTAVKPQLAVYAHLVLLHPPGTPEQTPQEIVTATRETYDGPLLVGEDLMSFRIDGNVEAGRASP
ncbi:MULTISPECIES: MBL fold metallo-hydrolase [unclassified Shinella]|uniref:MBL fold metallo-hydrolase n=1 Tax=unclassified Shinella TaxID=2643062 RepID=UPI00234F6113|nr:MULTISPECIES: MBL fold metallo-hydrolase [unclassified Shinella]MCO5154034.1 MBL fold metallo-hydrolase [Shinella sp.]MDC7266956.1 MBL fold metallo-hydrolase [Shinella sp. HY16]MDC7273853.1 MBL fold metallo-hydrolase [Shinella sp. YZ44]